MQGTHRDEVKKCATYYMGVISQKQFCIENSVPCWSFLVCELQEPFYSTPMSFISINVMVWAQCQILNYMAT